MGFAADIVSRRFRIPVAGALRCAPLAVLALALGCGGGDEQTPEAEAESGPRRVVMPSAAPPPREQRAQAPIVAPAPPVPVKPQRFDHVPEIMSQLPQPKNLELQYGEIEPEGTGTARYEGAGDPNSVLDELTAAMKDAGWEVRLREQEEGIGMIFMTKGDDIAQATAATIEPGKVRVDLNMANNAELQRIAEERQRQRQQPGEPAPQGGPTPPEAQAAPATPPPPM
jgi:hypothetical protein